MELPHRNTNTAAIYYVGVVILSESMDPLAPTSATPVGNGSFHARIALRPGTRSTAMS